jgi:hypothetical protein
MGIMLAIVPRSPAWQTALFVSNLLAFAGLLARIVTARLVRSYPALVLWLGTNIVLSVALWSAQMTIQSYYWFYMWAQGSTEILYLLSVLELYGKVLKDLRGLAFAARWAIPIFVTAAAGVSCSLLALEGTPVRYIDYFYRVDLTIITCAVLLVLAATAFLVWFPVRVSRNTVVYSVGYAAYLVPVGAGLFLMNSGHVVRWVASATEGVMSALCLVFWALALNRAGETVNVSPGRQFHPNDEARLLAQLEAANRMMLRVRRK